MAASEKRKPIKIPHFMPICSTESAVLDARLCAKLLADTASVMMPTNWGATEAPKSPPAAIMAYITTPPVGIRSAATIKLPGHNIETQKPVKAQAISPTMALFENTAIP